MMSMDDDGASRPGDAPRRRRQLIPYASFPARHTLKSAGFHAVERDDAADGLQATAMPLALMGRASRRRQYAFAQSPEAVPVT